MTGTVMAWAHGRLCHRTLHRRALHRRAMTATLVLAGLCACAFAGLTLVVLAGDTAGLDRRVHDFVIAHRAGPLTMIMYDVTWLGSSFVLVPLLLITSALLLRAGRLRAAVYLWVAFLGAAGLHRVAKLMVQRPRPPAANLIGPASGWAYPSGHSTQAVAAWGMLAAVLVAGRSRRVRALALTAAAAAVLLVGASRIYLGAHWPTDVLGGYALGGGWLGLLLALYLGRTPATQYPPGVPVRWLS